MSDSIKKAIIEIDKIMADWNKKKTTSDRGENRRYDRKANGIAGRLLAGIESDKKNRL